MKQFILGFSLVFCVFGISALCAQENTLDNKVVSVLKQNEISTSQAEFLFGTSNLNELNVEILSQKELKETQGEFWNWGGWFFKWIKIPLIPPLQVCNACILR